MNLVVSKINKYLKAHLAGVGAALTLLISDLNSKSHLTSGDLYAIIGAYLATGAIVAVAPNTAETPAVPAPDVDLPDASLLS